MFLGLVFKEANLLGKTSKEEVGRSSHVFRMVTITNTLNILYWIVNLLDVTRGCASKLNFGINISNTCGVWSWSGFGGERVKLWHSMMVVIYWNIWKDRNNWNFRHVSLSINESLHSLSWQHILDRFTPEEESTTVSDDPRISSDLSTHQQRHLMEVNPDASMAEKKDSDNSQGRGRWYSKYKHLAWLLHNLVNI